MSKSIQAPAEIKLSCPSHVRMNRCPRGELRIITIPARNGTPYKTDFNQGIGKKRNANQSHIFVSDNNVRIGIGESRKRKRVIHNVAIRINKENPIVEAQIPYNVLRSGKNKKQNKSQPPPTPGDEIGFGPH